MKETTTSDTAGRASALWAAILGGLAAALGLGAVVGWHVESLALVRVHPAFVPLQYGTALCIILCGAGLFLAAFDRRPAAAVFGGLAVLFAVFSPLLGSAGIDTALERILAGGRIAEAIPASRRSEPVLVLGILLMGSALASLGLPNLRRRAWILGVPGILLAAFGLVAFFGLLAGMESAFGWESLARLPILAAVSFAVLGFGLAALARREAQIEGTGGGRWFALMAGLGAATVALCLSMALDSEKNTRLRWLTEGKVEEAKAAVESLVEGRLLALERLAKGWEGGGLPSKERWLAGAGLLPAHLKGLRRVFWLDPASQARWIVPPEASEAVLGREVLLERGAQAVLQAAWRTRRAAVVRVPAPPEEGGAEYLIAYPVFRADVFQGFVAGLLNPCRMIKEALPEAVLKDYGFSLFVAGREACSRGSGPWDPGRVREIYLKDDIWRLSVRPGPEVLRAQGSVLPKAVLAVGLLLAFLLAWSLHLRQVARDQAAEIKRRKAELEAAGEAKSRFLGNISREFRNPLNAIIGFSELTLRSEAAQDVEKREDLSIVLDNGKRLAAIIDQLLELARLESGKVTPAFGETDGPALLEEACKAFSAEAAAKGLSISIEAEAAHVPLLTDGKLLGAILKRIVGNAVKFTSEGSVKVSFTDRENDGVFMVRDTGTGIDHGEILRLFEPFWQSESLERLKKAEGIGLGLHLSKRYADLIGGMIWADSERGKGTAFFVSVPKTAAPQA